MNISIKKKPLVHTERLTIKPYSAADREQLAELLTNEEITKTFMVPDFENREQVYSLVDKLILFSRIEDTAHLEYGIYLDNRMIGFVNDCGTEEDAIEIGYVIHPKYQGHGYATEAVKTVLKELQEMGFQKVMAGFFEENTASRKVMEKAGMYLTNEVEEEEYRGKRHKCFYYEMCFPQFVTLREKPEIAEKASEWFHSKWFVPMEAYRECMEAYLSKETEYGWYLCLENEKIVAGLGVIANDFHDRKDLTPNICAVYTEEAYRGRGIAGRLLHMAVEDLRAQGISPVYLITDHIGFYERYGWEFLCMVQGDGEAEQTRMYIHR